MIDMLDLYELRNHLFHLYLTDTDIPIVINLIKDTDFQGIEKLDILYIILQTGRKKKNEFTDEEIYNKCSNIVDRLANISIYDYTEDELNKIKMYYFLPFKYISNAEEANEYILKLESMIINENLEDLEPAMRFVNEQLRMYLLAYYSHSGDYYEQYEDKILYNLNIAKEQKEFKLKIGEILGN